ncbi:PREDICTED: cytochrome b561 and DOMON domain-containing protein At3g25290-like [Ipomoea nil]|uniref:cytochrome b561 and DOMON domain-containing protein At3g25290-like n=1 Tax=Ipomoea nil TaxID=35883 RepID=UPI00090111BF|nr:PREDICTED: cytochrome b561 and DOMON domain-containing protein At3g25290-like [Ipomoea nil]
MSSRLQPRLLFFLFLVSLILRPQLSSSASCTNHKFSRNRSYEKCTDLQYLNSYIHWTYDSEKSLLRFAFLAPPGAPEGWVSWAINPNGTGMVGAQSLIAFKRLDGSMAVKTYSLNSYRDIREGELSFEVSDMEGEYSGGVMTIFATVKLPEGSDGNVNQVWQVGNSVVNGESPAKHEFQEENLKALGKLDLVKGESFRDDDSGNSKLRNKNIHGILNVVSWGILFPVGIIMARYVKTFSDPAWFYAHVTCQLSSYVVGVGGWGTGMKLGSQSTGIVYSIHRNLGITLFCFATLQVFALFLRPNKNHKYRLYWNIYHQGIGYGVLILGIINVFKGFEILQPQRKWKVAYISLLSVLGGIALVLELVTWTVVLKRKKMINDANNN